jgi:hypothetical protein
VNPHGFGTAWAVIGEGQVTNKGTIAEDGNCLRPQGRSLGPSCNCFDRQDRVKRFVGDFP